MDAEPLVCPLAPLLLDCARVSCEAFADVFDCACTSDLPALTDVWLFAETLVCELVAVCAEAFSANSVAAGNTNQILLMALQASLCSMLPRWWRKLPIRFLQTGLQGGNCPSKA